MTIIPHDCDRNIYIPIFHSSLHLPACLIDIETPFLSWFPEVSTLSKINKLIQTVDSHKCDKSHTNEFINRDTFLSRSLPSRSVPFFLFLFFFLFVVTNNEYK